MGWRTVALVQVPETLWPVELPVLLVTVSGAATGVAEGAEAGPVDGAFAPAAGVAATVAPSPPADDAGGAPVAFWITCEQALTKSRKTLVECSC